MYGEQEVWAGRKTGEGEWQNESPAAVDCGGGLGDCLISAGGRRFSGHKKFLCSRTKQLEDGKS